MPGMPDYQSSPAPVCVPGFPYMAFFLFLFSLIALWFLAPEFLIILDYSSPVSDLPDYVPCVYKPCFPQFLCLALKLVCGGCLVSYSVVLLLNLQLKTLCLYIPSSCASFDHSLTECKTQTVSGASDAKSDSFPRIGSFRTDRLIEPVQKADSSVPDIIKQ